MKKPSTVARSVDRTRRTRARPCAQQRAARSRRCGSPRSMCDPLAQAREFVTGLRASGHPELGRGPRPSALPRRPTPPAACSGSASVRSSSLALLLRAEQVAYLGAADAVGGGPLASIQVCRAFGRERPSARIQARWPARTSRPRKRGPLGHAQNYTTSTGPDGKPTRHPPAHASSVSPRDRNDPRRGGRSPGRRPSPQRRPGGCSPARTRAGLAPGPLELRPRSFDQPRSHCRRLQRRSDL